MPNHFWPHLTGLVAVSLIFGGPIIGWIIHEIASNWRKVRISEQLAVLKQSMIERGMSAEEIERVLHAGTVPSDAPAQPRQTTHP